jgi:flagellar motor switch protein FliG
MSIARVFSFSLLLKGSGRADSILALLDDRELACVRTELQSLGSIPRSEIRNIWSKERSAEEDTRLQSAKENFGFEEKQLPAALVKWLVQRG